MTATPATCPICKGVYGSETLSINKKHHKQIQALEARVKELEASWELHDSMANKCGPREYFERQVVREREAKE